MIARHLAQKAGDLALLQAVTEYALIHDSEEWYTGDIPSPFKRDLRTKCPAVTEHLDSDLKVPDKVRGIVKLADCLEAIHFLREYGGSRTAQNEIYSDILLNFDKQAEKYEDYVPHECMSAAWQLRDTI